MGISGKRDRMIEIFKVDNGYQAVVFGGWDKWKHYYDLYRYYRTLDPETLDSVYLGLDPREQLQWKQNYPDLIANDLASLLGRSYGFYDEDHIRNIVYIDLLKRGVNKWLAVRYFLVRYKKLVANWRNGAWNRYIIWKSLYDMAYPSELGKDNYMKGYWKGYYDAMRKVRADLKTLCNTPRYVIWNGNRIGVVVSKKISSGWLRLVKELYDIRFDK